MQYSHKKCQTKRNNDEDKKFFAFYFIIGKTHRRWKTTTNETIHAEIKLLFPEILFPTFHSSNFFAFVFSFISSFFSPVLSLLFAFCFITILLFSIECHHNCSALCRCEFCGCCLLFSKLLYMCSSLLFLLCMTMSVQFSCSFYESQLSRAPTHDGDDDDMGNVCILKQAIKKTKKM